MNQKELRQVTTWIESVLRDWDPIGVSAFVGDEYDSYAPMIAQLLTNGVDEAKLINHLSQIETNTMGLQGDRVRCAEIARCLSDGFANRRYLNQP